MDAFVYQSLDQLLAEVNPNNPKDHDVGLITQSIERFGFVGAVTKDEESGSIVAGHGRLKALAAMRRGGKKEPNGILPGWKTPVRYEHFANDKERDAYLIADNQTTIRGGWHEDQLAEFLAAIAKDGGDDALVGTGFDLDDLDEMLRGRDEALPTKESESAIERVYGGKGRFGVTVNVETEDEENHLVSLLDGHGFWVKRHSR